MERRLHPEDFWFVVAKELNEKRKLGTGEIGKILSYTGQIIGTSLAKAALDGMLEKGLVVSKKNGRSFEWELTEKGKGWFLEEERLTKENHLEKPDILEAVFRGVPTESAGVNFRKETVRAGIFG